MLRCGFCGSRYPIGSSRHSRQLQRFMCRVDRLKHRINREETAPSAPLLAGARSASDATDQAC
jgi:hypothetical protein